MAMVTKKKHADDTPTKSAGIKSRPKKVVGKRAATELIPVSQDKTYAAVFKELPNFALTAQYIRTYQFNQRQGHAQTKTRGDVAGSGKKPWKQKGTGRARVGSIRTPVWRHGGVSHGPVAKDWSLEMPKKMRAKAFLTALSAKVLGSRAFFIEEFNINEGRTKEVIALIKGWNLSGKLVLIVDQKNHTLQKGTSNLARIKVVDYRNLNTYQVLWANAVVFEKNALDKLKEKYAKNK